MPQNVRVNLFRRNPGFCRKFFQIFEKAISCYMAGNRTKRRKQPVTFAPSHKFIPILKIFKNLVYHLFGLQAQCVLCCLCRKSESAAYHSLWHFQAAKPVRTREAPKNTLIYHNPIRISENLLPNLAAEQSFLTSFAVRKRGRLLPIFGVRSLFAGLSATIFSLCKNLKTPEYMKFFEKAS